MVVMQAISVQLHPLNVPECPNKTLNDIKKICQCAVLLDDQNTDQFGGMFFVNQACH
jgi:hypothetical protein